MIEKIQAGDTFEYTVTFDDYPAGAGWSCIMLLRGAGAYSISSTAEGDSFVLAATAAATGAYTAGDYEYFIYVSKSPDRFLVEKGSVEILADFTATTTYDPRSWARITLEALEAVIQGRATKDQMSYEIAGRKLEKIPIPDLIALRSKLKYEIESEKKAERIANGLSSGNKILLRL